MTCIWVLIVCIISAVLSTSIFVSVVPLTYHMQHQYIEMQCDTNKRKSGKLTSNGSSKGA
ncbi:hypothetical protein K439DRAFT_1642352 [Ramaria rubella]|nr:hypothetical protein K439DRAFT_1642352 [Ramaria rubella]